MPTTITSAGITFNDTTTLTSANIGTAQLVNGSVTASKLGTNEQKQICKAWVNFSGSNIASVPTNPSSAQTISCSFGETTGTWTDSTAGWTQAYVGLIYKITQINGVTGGTLGGVDVSTLGIQITSVVNSTTITFKFLSGTTISAQSVTGTGSSSSGFSYQNTGIRSSYNVSSVTKNGTGDYTVNFPLGALADAYYSVAVNSSGASSSSALNSSITLFETNAGVATAPTSSSFRFFIRFGSSFSSDDSQYLCVQVFGN